MELQSLIPRARRNDTPVVGVSPDPVDEFQRVIRTVTARTGGAFQVTLLSDAQHQVIDLYGLRNEEEAAGGVFLPHPTTYLVDKSGRVRWKFTEENQAVRPTNEMILAELKKFW